MWHRAEWTVQHEASDTYVLAKVNDFFSNRLRVNYKYLEIQHPRYLVSPNQ